MCSRVKDLEREHRTPKLPPTFAYDEATLISWYCVCYLLDATRRSHAPVATATASSSGYCEASEAIPFLGRKQSSGEDFCHCHPHHFSSPGGRLSDRM